MLFYILLFVGAMVILYAAAELGSKWAMVTLVVGVASAVFGSLTKDTTLFVIGVVLTVLSTAPMIADALEKLEAEE